MVEDFDQYSVPIEEEHLDRGAADRNSIEESFNQYENENLDKFLENDRRQEERKKLA